jgi:flagellar basal body-associated protein FliL
MDQQPAQPSPVSSSPIPASTSPVMPPVQPSTTPPPASPPPPPQVKKSSSMWIVVIIVVLLILAVAGWYLYQSMYKTTDLTYQNSSQEQAPTATPTITPTPTVGAVKSGDTQLDQQSDAIDANMMKLDTDVNNVDKGLNDTSVDLSS